MASVSFLLLCVFLLTKGLDAKERLCFELEGAIQELESAKLVALETREDLQLQIQSRGDSDWMELVLKKRLGVVPEGQIKVYFKKDE